MCNLFSMTKGQQAIRELAGAMRDTTGNLPMLPGIFPRLRGANRPYRYRRCARDRRTW